MAKLITAFAFCFVGASLLASVMEGGGGIATTALNGNLDSSATTITVDDTGMFLGNDYIIIEEEKIHYTGKTDTTFTGCTRGDDGTEAVAHADGALCMTEDSGVINYALGFNIGATAATFGALSIVTIPWMFFTVTLPRLIMWNFNFLQGELAIIAFFFFAVSIGLVVVIAMAMYSAGMGILRR